MFEHSRHLVTGGRNKRNHTPNISYSNSSSGDGFIFRVHADGHTSWELRPAWCREEEAVCQDCGGKLSKYNPNDYCAACLDRRAKTPDRKEYDDPKQSITADVRKMLLKTLTTRETVNLYRHFRYRGWPEKSVSTAISSNTRYFKRRDMVIVNVRGEGHRLEAIA